MTLTVLNEGPLKSSTQSDPGNQTAAPPAKIKTMRLENPQKPLKTPRLPDLDPYLVTPASGLDLEVTETLWAN